MKTHYELLGLEPSADAESIKKAFRREIARYHPDKVIHLGAEFQEMASTRAAELTVAYKTLTDPSLREEYDVSLAAGLPPPHQPQPPRPEPPPPRATPPDAPIPEYKTPPPGGGKGRFAGVRADRDVILKRAIAGRVRAIVEGLYGKLETPAVRGFDLAMVPVAKARFLGSAPPRVLVKVVESADAAAIADAYTLASRAGVHAGKSPVVVTLFARNIAPQSEISKANEANSRQRQGSDAPGEIAVVVVDTADWSCRLPPDCSKEVQKLADALCE
ncbi:MAG: J domain-containing protein [Cyanobacteria bacterium]|nr:J domain-containing protein [Cyanobacteriota bacterium]